MVLNPLKAPEDMLVVPTALVELSILEMYVIATVGVVLLLTLNIAK